jgi:putative hydrolase of the HAD superfamily
VREWYWSDPGRHRVGRLDLFAARREIVVISLRELGVEDPALAG